MIKIFITGSTGYIGHELALFLARKGYMVHALVRDEGSNNIPKHENITLFKGDLCDFKSIEHSIKDCEYVFHTAAFTDLRCKRIENFYSTNVDGTKNVLDAALAANVKKVIYTSTLSVYGPAMFNVPIKEDQPRLHSIDNDYELTKTMAEEIILDYAKRGLNSCILNVSRVYGPGLKTYSNGINGLINKFINNQFFVVPNKLEIQANYIFIQDVLDAHLAAIKEAKNGERYIVGGENSDYNRLFGLIKNIAKSEIKIIKVNYKVLNFLIRSYNNLASFLKIKILVTPQVLRSLFTHRSASSNKAINHLNFEITPLKIGLENTINQLNREQ